MNPGKLSIAVAICTFNRNEPLRNLLDAVLANSMQLGTRAKVGVVVVDDSSDGNARQVIERYEGKFELCLIYICSGKQNISIARNLAIEAASKVAEWTVMVDDDCEPVIDWLDALLETQAETGADAVTGPMIRRVPQGSPRWLEVQPFLELGLEQIPDGKRLTSASTFNSLISSHWLQQNPEIRFEPSLGVIGGEDMVFYRRACAHGLKIHFSRRALVYEHQPHERATFSYQLRAHLWHGNSSSVASVESGVSRLKMFLHGVNSLRRAVLRPFPTPRARTKLAA